MVDCAVQTEEFDLPLNPRVQDKLETVGEGDILDNNREEQLNGFPNTPNEDTGDLITNPFDYEHVELDDLKDLEAYIYGRASGKLLPVKALELVSEDRVLSSIVSAILNFFGDKLPSACVPGNATSPSKGRNSTSHEAWASDRYNFPRHVYIKGNHATSSAQQEFDKMEELLQYILCRYAIANDRHDLAAHFMYKTPANAYFGLFKLAINKDNLEGFRLLLRRVQPENIDPAFKFPTVREYAALRGHLSIMVELLRLGINTNGNERTYPLGAAVASESIEAVQLLLEWGATLDGKDRKSIVKEYSQTLITIAASNSDVAMIKYLVSAGVPPREPQPYHDALLIALADRRASMTICLLRSGIIFTKDDPPLERALEIAVEQGNVGLAELALDAGADPNVEEHSI